MNKTSRMRLLAIQVTSLLIVGIIALGLLEATLRMFPSLIGIAALSRFEPQMRSAVAARLGLPTLGSVLKITPEERTDGGPTILLPDANSLTQTFADQVDLELGAVEEVKVDQNGLCNDPGQTAEGKADVFLAGDSFTFCTAVPASETAAFKLGKLANETVYNLGIRGTGPYEYLEMMKRHAPAMRPGIAIMNIYEGNDLRDVLRTQAFIADPQSAADPRQVSPAWSYAAQFLKANAAMVQTWIKTRTGSLREFEFRYTAEVAGKPMAMNTTNRDQDEAETALRLQRGEVSIEEFRAPLSKFVEWARAQSITPVVTYTPSMYTAYDATVSFADPVIGTAVREASALQRKWLADNATAIGFSFLDLTPAFQSAAASGALTHFPANVHLTPKGHDIVAAGLAGFLRDIASR